MKLWLIEFTELGAERHGSYDCNFGFVVRAESEVLARSLAAGAAADEDHSRGGYTAHAHNPWLYSECSTCIELTAVGPEEIVLTDFSAG